MTSPLMTQRIFWIAVSDEQRFTQLLNMLERYRGAVDAVSIFTEADGRDFRFIPIEEVRRRVPIMRDRVERLRDRGFRPMINVLNSMGHSDYSEGTCVPLPGQGIVTHKGEVSVCCGCPRDPDMQDYITEKYQLYASCRPELLWIDDDVRMFFHPPLVNHGCFCDRCLDMFFQIVGKKWGRVALYEAIVANTYPEINQVRLSWMKFLSQQSCEIHKLIRDVVVAADPTVAVGAMNTQLTYYTAYYADFPARYEVTRTATDHPVIARPGGGFFDEREPAEVFHKAWGIALQDAWMPPNTHSLAEVESYPFQRFDKSLATTLQEAALYLAAGCEGVAFDTLGNLGNDPTEHSDYLEVLHRHRPYLKCIEETLCDATPLGLRVPFDLDHSARVSGDGKDLSSTDCVGIRQANGWGFIGMPLRFDVDDTANAVLLPGDVAMGLPKETLADLLSRGVITDAKAVEHLWQIGLGELTGVRITSQHDTGTWESFEQHPFNEQYENYAREVLQAYYPHTASTSEPITPEVQTITKLRNYEDRVLGVASTSYVNERGGRVVVQGYRPWDYFGLPGRIRQAQRIAAWANGAPLTAWVQSLSKLVLWTYRTRTGSLAAVVFNASMDVVESPILHAPGFSGSLNVMRPEDSKPQMLDSATDSVALPSIPGWSHYLIEWSM
ncbi:MAG: hypothetical protein JKX85_12580 [Phycisphaeraceae bacterium]|nr:hypothetical protein [Phycisphaeraceae bacterium]